MADSKKVRGRSLLKAKVGLAGAAIVACASMTACNLVAPEYYPYDLSQPKSDLVTPADQAQSTDQNVPPDDGGGGGDLASMPDKS